MSKLIAFLFGSFIVVWVLFVIGSIISHLSKVVFSHHRIWTIKEFFTLLFWFLAILNQDGREKLLKIIKGQRRKNETNKMVYNCMFKYFSIGWLYSN